MSLNLNDFKKATTTATATPEKPAIPTKPAEKKLDINAFKVQKPEEKKGLLKKYQTASVDIVKNTSAYGFEGVSRAAGGFTDLTGRAVALASKGAGKVGSGIYRGIGNVVGLFSDKGEIALDKVAEDFKKNQYQFAERFKKEGMNINSFLSKAGSEARETLLKTDKEAYTAREKKLQDRAENGTEFSVKDMTEADFWVHDIYGGLLQNAPTMALSLYAGGGAGASNTVLNFLAKAGTATAFSTGMNASIEAESAYSSALDEGKSEEEALAEADRVFKRNSIANSGLEAAQMMLLFAPQLKVASPVIKALFNTAKLGTAGALEAGQERMEDNIQDQAGNEKFDFEALTASLTQKGISRTDAVAFVLGMLFQGGGNVFVNEKDVEKAAKDKVEEVAAILPDDGEGGTAEQKIERYIENDPTAVEAAVQSLDSEIATVTDVAREEAKIGRLSDFAQEAIDAGKSPAEVVVALSGQIPTTRAQEIVDSIEPRVNVLKDLPTAESLMETSPAKLQKSLETLDADFKKNTTELKSAIERLQAEIKAAPKNSQEKLGKKKELETTRAELRKIERDFQQQIEEGGVETRRTIERYVIDNTNYSRAEQRALADRISKKIFSTPVDVPISMVVKNEMRKFAPATAAKQADIEAAIAKVVPDKKQQEKLLDEALEILQDKDFEAVVADMSIDEVVTELAKKDGQFQLKNATRKPTGKAKFKNIKDDDLAKIATYIEAVRTDSDFSFNLETDVKRLAERYGINPEQSMKQLTLALERLIERNNMDERIDALVIEAQTKAEAKKKTETKKPAAKKPAAIPEKIGNKPNPAWIKQQLQGLSFMKNVPVRMVDRITTPEGYEAFGRFINGIVEYVENPDITTIPHEAFHVASQMGLTQDERKALYKMAQEAYADPSLTTDLATEERLAQDFAEWYITEQNPSNLSDRIIGYFRKIKDFILDMVTKQNRAALKEIYQGMLSPEIQARVEGNNSLDAGRFFQNRKLNQNDTLLAVHNLTAENLLKADEIGGLANPSVAVLDPDLKVLTGFGDITLLGNRKLVTSNKAKTYAADVYSPRFPSTENTYNWTKADKFKTDNGIAAWDFDLERFSYEASRSQVLKEMYLKKTGKIPKDFKRDSYEDTVKINELILKNEGDFANFLIGVRKEVGADNERIFLGFSPSGNRKYRELTAENASKYMNQQAQQGGESFFYGLASLRAVLAPNISTVAKMKKSQDKLASEADFEKVKEQYEAEFTALLDELAKYHEESSYFGSYADTAEHLADYYRGYRDAFSSEYGYQGVPDELLQKARKFADKLRAMPTEYFETKFKRVVDISEFSAAVIPANLTPRARKVLEGYGLPIFEYNNETDRGAVIKQAATAGESLFFQEKRQVDALYKGSEEDPEESSIMKDLSNQLEQIMFEVETMFELAEAGYRIMRDHDATNSDSPVIAVQSTFPKWIPEHLRSRELMDKVLTQINNGEAPKGTRQAELHQVIEDYVLNRLPVHLQDEKVLLDYYAEQAKVEDDLRRDALALMKALTLKIAERPSVLKKGEVKNVIRTKTGQIRTDTKEFSRKLKERARFFNRGYKKGYKQGASDKFAQMLQSRVLKRDRNSKLDKVKSIYRRVRQATRTGAYLPIEYQERLSALFEDFDMKKMNRSTQEKLSNMAIYFAQQEGEVPSDIAKKLERISKFSLGDMTDAQLTQFVEEVTRIYENGVLKKKLMDRKDEKAFAEKVKRVVDSTTVTNRGKLNLSTYDPTRFADMLDGGKGRYTGANFKEIVEPLRVVTDQADIESNALLAESLEEIGSLGNSFSEEEMARMMHTSALEQGAPDQAEALAIHYKDYDFVSALTEKERGALEIMKETFREIRPEVAATYEEINNIPFPENPDYFPFRYDKEVEKFDITEADFFDFKPAKTASGFTMARQQGVNRVLDINIFQTFAQQVQAQIYYAKVQPVLNMSKDIVNSKPYQAQITSVEQDYWRTFLADVATRGRRGGSENAEIKAFASKIRQNINTAILGYKLSTVLIQPTAIFDAMSNVRKDLGMVAALKILPQFLNMTFNPRALATVRDQSLSLQTRAGGQIELKELQDAQKGMFNDSPWRRGYAAFQRYAFAGIKFADIRVAASIVEATRREYVKKGMSKEDAMLKAEQIMMLSQASSNIANRPQFFNSEGTKFLLPFQTFVVNAFNNVRYDAVGTELKEKGAVRGTISAGLNLQFFVYAVGAEALLRELYGALWGYEDDEEKTWLEKWFVSAISRLPAINYLIKYDGEFTGEVNIDHPAVQATDRVLNLLAELSKAATSEDKELSDIGLKDVYQAARGLLTLLGVAGTQQLHQILTAPEIAGYEGIGMELGLAFDDRTNVEKRADVTKEVFETGEPLTEATITEVAEKVYGKDYIEGDAQYKADKNLEVIKELTIREEYGFDDGFVNAVLAKKSNNDVKAYVASNEVNLKDYSRPLKKFGVVTDLMSKELITELMYIERATPAEREKIAALAAAEDDTERREVIAGDKNFAKKAFSQYKIIPKAFYESI